METRQTTHRYYIKVLALALALALVLVLVLVLVLLLESVLLLAQLP